MMALQTSDTPNGLLPLPPAAGLPADPATAPEGHPCGAIPPQGCARALHASPRVLLWALCGVTASALGWPLGSPQCLQEVTAKPSWDPPASPTAAVSSKEPSYLSSRFLFPAGRSPLARASIPCARAVMCCISTSACSAFETHSWGLHPCGSLSALELPEHV